MKKILFLFVAIVVFSCSNKQDEIKQLSQKGISSISEVAKFLDDPDMKVRKTAAKALGKIGTEQSIVYLKAYRDDAKQREELIFANSIIKKIKATLAPKKPKFVKRAVNKNDPLETQVINTVYNFMFRDGVGYGPKDELELKVKGNTVINYTDMTEFYENTLRIKDWKTFYEYIKRAVLGYPTGDITAEIFKKFPQMKTFSEVAYVKENGKKKTVGKAKISRKSFYSIDSDTKEYLDKLSVSQEHFGEFEGEVGKYIKGIWYDKTIAKEAKDQVSKGL